MARIFSADGGYVEIVSTGEVRAATFEILKVDAKNQTVKIRVQGEGEVVCVFDGNHSFETQGKLRFKFARERS